MLVNAEEDKKPIADNIEAQARWSDILYIWTDCDREGENIGAEIRDIALKIKPGLLVRRARFNNTERSHVIQAAQNPIELDEKQSMAVAARIELDLRTGAAITRQLTLNLQPMVPQLMVERKVISYGSCQFPTLGFVVDQYFRVQNFVPETFWTIKVMHKKDGQTVTFNWKRVHLFDRLAVVVLYERCLNTKTAKVTKMETKPTSKWKPLPLTTVELQKNGTKYLRMTSAKVMQVAENLYTKGWISYPRTETDRFDSAMDLRALVQKQTQSPNWGTFAQGLLNGGFRLPRAGQSDDKAHPPIHPVNFVAQGSLNAEEQRLYEFVVRRFLACCSEDAKGKKTTIEIEYGSEMFHTQGTIVLERNYLDVYPYDKWTSDKMLPNYTVGETFVPTEAKMKDGKTSPPKYLTETELLDLMNKNGIGTDATAHDHIAKIKDRDYVRVRQASRTAPTENSDEDEPAEASGRGGRGGRGGSRAGTGRGGGGQDELIPTTLGVALIEGYNNLEFETSLSKPHLRKEVRILVPSSETLRKFCSVTFNILTNPASSDGASDESDL